ncbi:MAG: response regulator, partial [Leptolyngbyaceae bacterium]|nr:response regulator [Leptolyngbyaceae bacterium]
MDRISQKKLILVIEDEPQMRIGICRTLELAGYEVIATDNGLTGVEFASLEHPDMIICDVMMPKMDGFEVLKLLRQDQELFDVPVIMLTAKSDRLDQRQGMEMGADDYITKPFKTEELLVSISTRLTRQEQFAQKLATTQARAECQIATLQLVLKEVQDQLQNAETTALINQETAEVRSQLLKNFCTQLSNPLSNINLSAKLLSEAKTEQDRERYLQVLRSEYEKGLTVLNEIGALEQVLSPANLRILKRFS